MLHFTFIDARCRQISNDLACHTVKIEIVILICLSFKLVW